MTHHDERVDPTEADRLDRMLDANSAAPHGQLPPQRHDGLSSFSNHLRTLDAQDVEPEPTAAFVRRLEENLMLHARDLHPPFDRLTRAAPLPSVRWTDRARPMPAPSRSVRTWALLSRSWLAAAALLAMFAASAFVVYLAAPGSGGDGPTQLGALQSATPEPVLSGDEITPLVSACDVDPRTLDEVISLLQWEPTNQPPYVPVSVVLAAPPNAPIVLPDGSAPTEVEIASVSATYGELWGCAYDRDTFRRLALYSDDGVIRNYYTDGVPHVGNIAYLGVPNSEAEWRGRAEIGEATPRSLSGIRKLSDGRIAAYVVPTETTVVVDGTPSSNSGFGYVVFVEVGGRWLIDESVYAAG